MEKDGEKAIVYNTEEGKRKGEKKKKKQEELCTFKSEHQSMSEDTFWTYIDV